MIAYDIGQSYEWNYQHAPDSVPAADVPAWPAPVEFCGLAVDSPLGIPAGPLLNSRWIRYYAALGFDVLTYKTVRSRFRACYDPPNLLPVRDDVLTGEGGGVVAEETARGAWAISFGMPSRDPVEWRPDVECARRGLKAGQALVVSVVASPEPGWTIGDLAGDFAQCAQWAEESGAQAVEANLSCPNVCTQEADLYLSPEASREIAAAVRAAITVPLILKIGLFPRREQAEAFVEAVSGHATAISATNSITAIVRSPDGQPLFGGARRGIGGTSITARCLEETRMLAEIIRRSGSGLRLVSVGGLSNARDVRQRLDAGAHHVQLATAAMLDPLIGVRIRREFAPVMK